jgi:tRNA(Ile2) C34 agmatinyltransferase TiaS
MIAIGRATKSTAWALHVPGCVPNFVPPYDGWAPYCLICPTMLRMKPTDYGWQCRSCGNPINRELTHYDGPANK